MNMNNNTSDQLAALLARCALKDQQALATLYKLTSAELYAVLLRILKNKTLAEETLQEAYMNIWKKADTYHHQKGEPMAWIVSIARYRALDILRQQKTRQQYEDLYEIEKTIQSPQFDETITDQDEAVVLGECLDRLQTDARRSVVMAYCEGYTHQELSEHLGKPIGTVKSWIRRSLKHLQECIHELSTP